MTNATASLDRTLRPVLADRITSVVSRGAGTSVGSRVFTDTALVLAGAALVGLLAQVNVPIWPVPVTGQTLAVVLVGASLGAWRGALSLATYLVAGLVGVPVFAGWSGGIGSLANPAFGYIVGFIVAAALIGWLSERRWDRRPLLAVVGFGLASAVPFVFGLPWLAIALARLGAPHSFAAVMASGFTPFVVGGLVKWAIAAAALPLAWKALDSRDGRRD